MLGTAGGGVRTQRYYFEVSSWWKKPVTWRLSTSRNSPPMEPDILEDGTLEFDMAQSHVFIVSASIREKVERVTLAVDPD